MGEVVLWVLLLLCYSGRACMYVTALSTCEPYDTCHFDIGIARTHRTPQHESLCASSAAAHLNLVNVANNLKTTHPRVCCQVGNSGSLLSAEHGANISRHSAVWRLNLAPTLGHARHVGLRTSVAFVNGHRINWCANQEVRKLSCFATKGGLWLRYRVRRAYSGRFC